MSGTAGKREPLLWRRAAPRVSVCLARAPGESERRERPQGASMYGDGVKYPHTVSEYWIQAGASMRILNTGLARYPKSIRVSMRLPAGDDDAPNVTDEARAKFRDLGPPRPALKVARKVRGRCRAAHKSNTAA